MALGIGREIGIAVVANCVCDFRYERCWIVSLT